MTDQTIITLAAAVPPTIAAIAALWVAVSNSRKADAVTAKVDVVHALTNDAKSKADASLAVANETITGLRALNASLTVARPVEPQPSVLGARRDSSGTPPT